MVLTMLLDILVSRQENPGLTETVHIKLLIWTATVRLSQAK